MTKIESVNFFYCSMPEVLDIGDGSQDQCVAGRAGSRKLIGELPIGGLGFLLRKLRPASLDPGIVRGLVRLGLLDLKVS